MNLYLRFFNDEVLVENVDQAIAFLSQLPDVKLDNTLRAELVRYAESNNPYPKRFKISSKVYFIVIKTTANTMEEFKAYATDSASVSVSEETGVETEKEALARSQATENPGWYHALIKFKRVLSVAGTGKFQYVDTEFEAKLKAHSVQDCYNRVVDHLRNRADIDPRSQFPSIRGRNFKADFLGA
ncbi:MAG: hypothetical protein K5778_07720 [Bacteroidaceae bacterium]|nr:hypothetical protein [Bacteroidaceae bacterium]